MYELALKRELILNKTICRMICLVSAVLMITLGAFVRIPLLFTPVPITLQTFFVLLTAGLLGPGLSFAALAGYIFAGALGMPVFTGLGGGMLYLLGPTGGYLLGFLLAGLVVSGYINQANGRKPALFVIFAFASVIILLSGVVWLKIFTGLTFPKAFVLGFLPFIGGDLLKAAAAAWLYLKWNKRVKQIIS